MTIRRKQDQSAKGSRHEDADKAALDAQPDWGRMGEIADRLLSTPPDRQAVGKASLAKQKAKVKSR